MCAVQAAVHEVGQRASLRAPWRRGTARWTAASRHPDRRPARPFLHRKFSRKGAVGVLGRGVMVPFECHRAQRVPVVTANHI